jgi:hypothetical protein
MRVRVSSQAERKAQRAEDAFACVPAALEAIAEFHAEYLRDTDDYQDRSGDLREHTVGRIVDAGADTATVELVMDMPYASYVRRLGLSSFYDVVKDMSANCNRAMAGIGKRI